MEFEQIWRGFARNLLRHHACQTCPCIWDLKCAVAAGPTFMTCWLHLRLYTLTSPHRTHGTVHQLKSGAASPAQVKADCVVWAQVAHRDIKSSNILICRDFTAKIADVGECCMPASAWVGHGSASEQQSLHPVVLLPCLSSAEVERAVHVDLACGTSASHFVASWGMEQTPCF